MKNLFWIFGLALLIPAYAQAQVQINPAALQQLQGVAPAAPIAQPVTAPPPVPHIAPHHKQPSKPKTKPQPAPKVEPAAKQPATKQPATPKADTPPHPAPSATPQAVPLTVQINFAPNSAVLPAKAAAALKPFCTSSARIPLLARAPATPDNPADAMQLSMQRAFAIRASLISCGVPAQNIIPQSTVGAFGPNSDEALIGAITKP